MADDVLASTADHVCTITLNRPKAKNAMNPQMHFDMCEALAAVERDDDCRVLVITGAGDSFCAGMDVKEYFYDTEEKPADRAAARKAAFEWMFKSLRLLPKPTIAAVNGWCFGGALAWLAVCDFAVASETATIGLSEVNWGIIPAGGVTKLVSAMLAPRDALYMIMTGRPGEASWTFRSTSMPFMPGMVMSVTTASNRSFPKSASPCSPLSAALTA